MKASTLKDKVTIVIWSLFILVLVVQVVFEFGKTCYHFIN